MGVTSSGLEPRKRPVNFQNECRLWYRNRNTYSFSATEIVFPPVFYTAGGREYIKDGQKNLVTIDIIVKSKELGEAGWELMDIASRSAHPNHAVFTTEETWIFKRAK